MNQTIEIEPRTDAVELKPAEQAALLELQKYASQTGLEAPAAATLAQAFRPVFVKAHEAVAAAAGVAESVKDATCVTEIKKSRACRLAIRSVRIEGEKVHKSQKENALRFGKAVDGFRNILLAEIGPVEDALQAAEDTAERAEATRKAALKATREAELLPLLGEVPFLVDLGAVPEASYQKMLADAKLLKQAKLDAAAKAEADRLAKEEQARRIAVENELLKQEAIAREAAAKAEREAAEKKLAEERAEAARIAADIKAKADADAKAAAEKAAKERAAVEAKAKAEREAVEAKAREEARKAAEEAAKLNAEIARRRAAEAEAEAKAQAEEKTRKKAAAVAAAAPDKAKAKALAASIRAIPLPEFSDAKLTESIGEYIERLAMWVERQPEPQKEGELL